MHDDRRRSGGGGGGHRRRRYPFSRPGATAAALALLLAGASAAAPAAAESLRRLAPDGAWHVANVSGPGRHVAFALPTVAGARYRVTAQPGTLGRPILEIRAADQTLWRVDAGASGAEAVHEFDAERDDTLTLRVSGFSAMTGAARVRLESIDPLGRRTTPHRRVLAPGGTLARVGELWIGESNRWDLVAEPGRAYEIRSTVGTAGPVVLAVRVDGAPAATTEGDPAAYPVLRFRMPERPAAGGPDPTAVLEVQGVAGAGGTYGVRMQEVSPAEVGPRATRPDPEGLPSGALEDVPLGFRVRAGDVVMLYLPQADPYDPHTIEAREDGIWRPIPSDAVSPHGQRAAVRTPEGAAAVAFRAHRAAELRFIPNVLPGAPGQPVLRVHEAALAGGAPLLLGSGNDPSVLGRSRPGGTVLGLGFCLPGFDYLYVAAGGGARDLSMRVRAMDGKVLAQRASGSFAGSEVAGLGPSLRFRVKEAQVVRLEVSGGSWRGYGLLRRASN